METLAIAATAEKIPVMEEGGKGKSVRRDVGRPRHGIGPVAFRGQSVQTAFQEI